MILFSTIAQIANYREEDRRTTKSKIGKEVVEFTILNKLWKQAHTGYANLSDLLLLVNKNTNGTGWDSERDDEF